MYNYSDLENRFNVNNELLKNYLLGYLLVHEVEHSRQKQMAIGKIKSPNRLVRVGYNNLYNLLEYENDLHKPFSSIVNYLRLLMYDNNHDNYVLERNANLTAASTMVNLCLYTDNKELERVFNEILKKCMIMGYKKDNKGIMYHTLKDLFLIPPSYDKLVKCVKEEDKIYYGLEISEEKRKVLLRKCK